MSRRVFAVAIACAGAVALLASCSSSSSPSASAGSSSTSLPSTSAAPSSVTWMSSYAAPCTPARYNKVGIIKVGPSDAKNVLVLEPGTSAGAAYFVPLAEWIVSKASGWQVWSVERRENLLEDQSELNLFKEHKVTSTQLYDYYLGYLKDKSITHHYQPVADSTVQFAKQWGMNVAVQDLHVVIGAAKKLGGKVVLGGHSLGGSVVTAYATWDFDGHAGANDLAGLVYIDGGSRHDGGERPGRDPDASRRSNAPSASPWLAFGGIPAPYAGVFVATGASAALFDPNAPSLGQASGLLPTSIVPPVRVSNVGQYGYALDPATSPVEPRRRPGPPRQGPRSEGAGPRLGRFGSAHAHRPLRHDVLGGGHPGRRRQRVVLPPTPDRRHRRGGQRQRQPGPDRARPRRDDGSPTAEGSADLRLRRAAGRGGRARGRTGCWRSNRAFRRPTSPWRTTRAPTRTTIRLAPTPTTPSSIGSSPSWERSPPRGDDPHRYARGRVVARGGVQHDVALAIW